MARWKDHHESKNWYCTLQGTNITLQRHLWRWFSLSKGGICQFPGGYYTLETWALNVIAVCQRIVSANILNQCLNHEIPAFDVEIVVPTQDQQKTSSLNFADTYSCRNFNNTSSGFLQPFFLPQLKFFFPATRSYSHPQSVWNVSAWTNVQNPGPSS